MLTIALAAAPGPAQGQSLLQRLNDLALQLAVADYEEKAAAANGAAAGVYRLAASLVRAGAL